jgi:hypothetical protein
VTGVLAAMGSSRSATSVPLGVTISGAGSNASGTSGGHTFPPTTAAGTGGSGHYTFAWSVAPDIGVWSFTGQGTASIVVTVAQVPNAAGGPGSNIGGATVTCTITDTVTKQSATSAALAYTYTHN